MLANTVENTANVMHVLSCGGLRAAAGGVGSVPAATGVAGQQQCRLLRQRDPSRRVPAGDARGGLPGFGR
eukprot:9485532-Pyramimonas_sp.AAC.2